MIYGSYWVDDISGKLYYAPADSELSNRITPEYIKQAGEYIRRTYDPFKLKYLTPCEAIPCSEVNMDELSEVVSKKNISITATNSNTIVDSNTSRKYKPTIDRIIKNNSLVAMDEFNELAIAHGLRFLGLEKIDLNNKADVEERSRFYFESCLADGMKPTVSGYANCLGVQYQVLRKIVSGDPLYADKNGTPVILDCYQFLQALIEDLSLNNKVNPAVSIFLMKNHFGYTDTTTLNIANVGVAEVLTDDELIRAATELPDD